MKASPGVYDPELVALMGRALEAAWEKFSPRPRDVDLARLLMAGAILERVNTGVSATDILTETAMQALHAALSSPLLQTALHRTPHFEPLGIEPVTSPRIDSEAFPNFPLQAQRAQTMVQGPLRL
jgi:hypothetical protein